MQNNVIPIRRGSQAELAKLYLHLLNVALNEKVASTAPHAWAEKLSMHPPAAASLRNSRACQPEPNSLFNQLQTMARHFTSRRSTDLLKARGAQAHCLMAHWKLSSVRKTGAPVRG